MGIDFDAVQAWLEDNNAPDHVVEAFTASPLRSVIAEKEAEIQRLKPFEGEVVSLKKAPTKYKAFEQVGVKYEDLPQYGKDAIDAFDWTEGDEPDLQAVADYASSKGFETSQPEAAQQPAAAQFARQAAAPAGVAQNKSIDDQIAEYQAAALDTSQSMEVRQKAQAAATALKGQKLRPAGLSATA